MQIGIISDTHGVLSPSVHTAFKNVEHIFHAGDIGSLEVIWELETIAPVVSVTGNMDDWAARNHFLPIVFKELKNKIICLTHDIVSLKNFSYELFKKNQKADIIIHGHTHRPSAEVFQNKLFLNPGSATHPRLQKNATVAILNLNEMDYTYKFIELD